MDRQPCRAENCCNDDILDLILFVKLNVVDVGDIDFTGYLVQELESQKAKDAEPTGDEYAISVEVANTLVNDTNFKTALMPWIAKWVTRDLTWQQLQEKKSNLDANLVDELERIVHRTVSFAVIDINSKKKSFTVSAETASNRSATMEKHTNRGDDSGRLNLGNHDLDTFVLWEACLDNVNHVKSLGREQGHKSLLRLWAMADFMHDHQLQTAIKKRLDSFVADGGSPSINDVHFAIRNCGDTSELAEWVTENLQLRQR